MLNQVKISCFSCFSWTWILFWIILQKKLSFFILNTFLSSYPAGIFSSYFLWKCVNFNFHSTQILKRQRKTFPIHEKMPKSFDWSFFLHTFRSSSTSSTSAYETKYMQIFSDPKSLFQYQFICFLSIILFTLTKKAITNSSKGKLVKSI